ncbi:IS4 family transposase [Bradyrhizobium uaiense]|uniref:IS4 family transposase n=1 Tax=Bradyrhizobium uaiense TaxID=2594946 RepID=A0A6P1BI42_9BRAD|nr:IS4 family transposase [Bradyrhizobium uaiense]NEU97889.1 IS4 family transposase [Bradyrhizobium uaiense]
MCSSGTTSRWSAGPDGRQDDGDESVVEHWTEGEIDKTAFKDARLGQRFGELLKQIGDGMGGSIPFACQDWANTKAAYRFFADERVEEADILSGHFAATRARYDDCTGPILLIQDTTEFSYQRANTSAIGLTKSVNSGRDKDGRWRHHTVCGMLMHSSLAVTVEGLPLGLAAVKFWTRKKFKGTAQLKKKINPTRVPIEKKESVRWLDNLRQSIERLGQPERCIHIGDRESDIYELYCLTQELGAHFLVRACVDRLAGDGGHTIATEMEETSVKGLHFIDARNDKGETTKAALEIKFKRIAVLSPIGKQKRYPALDLTIIHATERGTPTGRKPIEWKLITDLAVRGRSEAIEKINWYAMRWKIEVFHKILKSGCKAEDSKLRTAERLANLMAVFCILSWRVLWLTMLNRIAPDASPKLALTDTEIALLDQLISGAGHRQCRPGTLAFYLTKLARLGGYLARAGDPPPGNVVIWRGLSRLTDIELGAEIASAGNVGN